jgi:nucleotide-binding universal stress UspA family protein
MSTIVVGYDASECARAALSTAIDVAKAYGDDVRVVVAYEVSRLGGEVQDFAKALSERAQEIVTLAQHQAAGLGAEIQSEILEERAPEALIEVADRVDARFIVVGSRGEGALRSALVGSTPHKLIQLSDRPLLLVPV